MSKVYISPRWWYSAVDARLNYWPGGEGEPGTAMDPNQEGSISIPANALHTLLPFLFEQGFLNTFLTKQSREEDLKITHRVLDLLDKTIKGG